jgi:hypothetical protein
MPLPGLRPLSELVSRLLRPGQAAQNAKQAATEARRTVSERQAVERDVDDITDSDSPDRQADR